MVTKNKVKLNGTLSSILTLNMPKLNHAMILIHLKMKTAKNSNVSINFITNIVTFFLNSFNVLHRNVQNT